MAFFYKTSQVFYVDFCRWQEANLLVLQFSLGFRCPNYVFLFLWCHESAFLLKYCVIVNHNVNYSRSGLFNNFISLIWIVTRMLHNFLLGGGEPKTNQPTKTSTEQITTTKETFSRKIRPNISCVSWNKGSISNFMLPT